MKITDYKPEEPKDILAWIKKPLKWIEKTFRGNPYRILFAAAGVLLIAAGIVWLSIYLEGNSAASNAQELLEAYEAGNVLVPSTDAPAATADNTGESLTPTPTQAPTPTPIPTEYEGYHILGKLTIEAIDQELPIISEMSRAALKVSVCYYQGTMIGEDGNMVITGHNYANGAHFGRLDEVKTGDVVVLTAPDLTEYRYEVYDTVVVRPDNEEALDETASERELTLLTCTSHGNRRLIVRCRSVSD